MPRSLCKFVLAHRHQLLLHAIATIPICLTLKLSLTIHKLFGSGIDLAIFGQFCWLISNKGVFANSTILSSMFSCPMSPLADHLSIVLLPISLIYKIFPSPATLIVIQALCAWLCILGIAQLVQMRLSNYIARAIVTLSLSLYPILHLQTMNDFHTDAFIMAVIPWLWISVLEKRLLLFWACLIVVLLSKETAPIVALPLGLMLLLKMEHRKFGLQACVASLVWFIVSQCFLLPPLRNHKPHPAFVCDYGYLGDSLSKALMVALMNPSKPMKFLLSEDALISLLAMLLPLSFLPLACPWAFITALVPFIHTFASSFPPMRSISYQGLMPLTALFMLGCVEGIANILRLISKGDSTSKRHNLSEFSISLWLLSLVILSWALAFNRQALFSYETLTRKGIEKRSERVEAIRQALRLIPDDAPVIASPRLLTHLSNREFAWLFGWSNPLRGSDGKLRPQWHGEKLANDVYIAVELKPTGMDDSRTQAEVATMRRWKQVEVLVENNYIVLLRYRASD